uniref:Uncharacterized protein n=1 Tax=Fagus sylvatica TaxID=28930 RepID=A0A2N9FER7_FAGSY
MRDSNLEIASSFKLHVEVDSYRKNPENAMDYLDEIAKNSYAWNGPNPLNSTDRNRSSTTTSGGSVFRLREEVNMSAKIGLLIKEIKTLKLKESRGVNAVYREEPMEACRICQEIDHTTCAFKVNLPLLHIIKQMPLYAKVIKDLCIVKRKHHVKKTAFLTEHVSAIIQHKVPPKYKDPSYPTVTCDIGDYMIERALIDLRANVIFLPFSMYLQLGLGELKPTSVTLQLADRSIRKLIRVVEDVLVKVDNFYYPVDFIILDIEPILHPSANIPIILGRYFLATANALINCRNGRMKITFGSMTMELNIFNVNPQQLVDEECEYVNFIEVAPQEEFDKNCFFDPFESLPVNSVASIELKPDVKLSNFSFLLDSSQILEEEQIVVAKMPPRSKKKSLHAYLDAPKIKLKQPTKKLTCASIEPCDTFTVEVLLKMSVDQEVEKEGEKTKFFERHKTKRKVLQDIRLSRILLNNSKGVDLHIARMKSARGRNYSFGGSRSGG